MGRKSCHSSLFSVARPLSKNDTGGQNGPCFCFFKNCNTVSCKDCNAKNSFLETVILLYCNAWGVINGSSAHRNLDRIYTDYFWVARAQEIFGGNPV